MKKIFQIFCLTILISNFAFSQNQTIVHDSIKYFDENYKPISKTEFETRNWRKDMISVQGDSINHQILNYREIRGTIKNKKVLDSVLSAATNRKIDSSKPIVILYYPGKDPCNSSGSANRKHFRKWYDKMEKGVNKIKESNIIYVYKDIDGLYGKYDGFKDWIKDPQEILEKLFFTRHYLCSSFVVISEQGRYMSYFGESSKENIWKSVRELANK